MSKFAFHLPASDLASCPYCSQPTSSPSFEQTVATLDLAGFEKSILEALWVGNADYSVDNPHGRPVTTETIHGLMYRDDSDCGPSPSKANAQLRVSVARLNGACRQLGIGVEKARRKGHYQLRLTPRVTERDVAYFCNCPCCGQGVERPMPEMAVDIFPLQPKQAQILLLLCRAKGQSVSTERIGRAVSSRQVNWHLHEIRQILENGWITISSAGYAAGHRAVMDWESAP